LGLVILDTAVVEAYIFLRSWKRDSHSEKCEPFPGVSRRTKNARASPRRAPDL
jgi:hypothetical protein